MRTLVDEDRKTKQMEKMLVQAKEYGHSLEDLHEVTDRNGKRPSVL